MDNLLLGKLILPFRGRLTCPYCCPAPPRDRARKAFRAKPISIPERAKN
jgi:hypothetical protein